MAVTIKDKKRQSKAALAKMRQKAKRLERMPEMPVKLGPAKWKAFSETSKMAYIIVLSTAGIVCGCPASQNGLRLCKHVVELDIRLNRLWNKSRKKIDIKKIAIRCHRCGSRNYICNGHCHLKRTGKKRQRYLCREEKCGASFSGIQGFLGRHHDSVAIVMALSYVACGMSSKRASENLKNGGFDVHPRTVQRWVDHYSGLLETYAKLLRVDVGFKWHVDEIKVLINGQKRWLFIVMDGATRTILAYRMSPRKSGAKTLKLFKDAAKFARRPPQILVSDGLQSFIKSADAVFANAGSKMFVHIREIHLKMQFNNNNKQERLNGEIADRLKNIRGLKSEIPGILRLTIAYHNFFRPHLSLNNKTPFHEAGVTIEGEREYSWDNWVSVIQNAEICVSQKK